MSKNLLAVQAIKRRALDESDEEMLLDILGLVAEDGTVPPDDTTIYNIIDRSNNGPGARNPGALTTASRHPEDLTTPPGLANLPPVAESPKVAKPRKPRPVGPPPPCGSYKAYSRHRRLGEDIDDACHQAELDYNRNRKTIKRRETEAQRLASAGVNPEAAQVLSELAR